MKIKVCFWCEGSPKGTMCNMAKRLGANLHEDECYVKVLASTSDGGKAKWNKLKV